MRFILDACLHLRAFISVHYEYYFKKFIKYVGGLVLLGIILPIANSALAGVNVLTNRYNQQRTSANLNETILTPQNVHMGSFGKLGKFAVDGVIYAQPLYVSSINVQGIIRNVLFVATMHDVLYAFDADNVGAAPLWKLDFRSAGVSAPPIHIGKNPGSDAAVADTMGIFGTPVIDINTHHILLVTQTLENGSEHFRLRSVDILTGALVNSVEITGYVPANGSYAAQTFVPPNYSQRPALELVTGQVWVAFGSRPPGDYTNYRGWVMTYDSRTLTQTGVYVTSRTGGNAIWQSGAGPAVDNLNNVYYLTGNGGTYTPRLDLPESLLKFSGNANNLVSWYTPYSVANNNANTENYNYLDQYDLDLSVNGPMLIPGTDAITFGSKTADLFVLNRNNLGGLLVGDPQVVQFVHIGHQFNTAANDADRILGMAYWQKGNGGTLFNWPGLDTLHALSFDPATLRFTKTFIGNRALVGQPGTALAVSANGAANGVVWAPFMDVTRENNTVGQPGSLHAYDASNPGHELWNSNMVAADAMGSLAKYVPPVVANGKVYVANSASLSNYSAGSVTVYGLLKPGQGYIPLPDGVAYCAGELQTCPVALPYYYTVWYGAEGSYVKKLNKTGPFTCDNATFGADPKYGAYKYCYVESTPPPNANSVFCANEGQTCNIPAGKHAEVWFGNPASGQFNHHDGMTGSVPCTVAAFGDPEYGQVKKCYYNTTMPF